MTLLPEKVIPQRWRKDWIKHKNQNIYLRSNLYFSLFIIVLLLHYLLIDIPYKAQNLKFWATYRFGVSFSFVALMAISYFHKGSHKIQNTILLTGGSLLCIFQSIAMMERREVSYFYLSLLATITITTSTLSLVSALIAGIVSFAFIAPHIVLRPEEAFRIISFHLIMIALIVILKLRIFDQVKAFISTKEKIELAEQIHHDLQAPLAVLDALAQKSPQANQSALLSQALKRVKDISSDLVGKHNAFGEKQRRNLAKDIADVIKEKKESNPIPTIKFNNSCEEIVYCLYDGSHFKRVISNLVNNSITASQKSQAIITIDLKQASKGKVQIVITDNGGGIPKNIQSKVFERGFSTKGTEGCGLGLFHAKECIEAWGGRIRITSMDIGTKVLISLNKED